MTHLPRCGPTGRWLVAHLVAGRRRLFIRSPSHCTALGRRSTSRCSPWGGHAGFFFLPPLVAQPTTGGAFDADIATLNPQVAICDVTLVPRPMRWIERRRDSRDRGVHEHQHAGDHGCSTASTYSVNWDTKLEGFVTGHAYRAHGRGRRDRGAARAGVRRRAAHHTPGQVKDLATGDLISLNDGRTLPIRFRIESGIPGALAVTAASASIPTDGTDLITATLRDLHGGPLVGSTVAWSVTADVGVAGTPPLDVTSGQTDAAGTTATTFKAGMTAARRWWRPATAGLSASATVSVTGRVVGKPL